MLVHAVSLHTSSHTLLTSSLLLLLALLVGHPRFTTTLVRTKGERKRDTHTRTCSQDVNDNGCALYRFFLFFGFPFQHTSHLEHPTTLSFWITTTSHTTQC